MLNHRIKDDDLMVKIEPFEKFSEQYDEWFVTHTDLYLAELTAIRKLVPVDTFGVEIGVGTGRFALPLGINVGVEPSRNMANISKIRGIHVFKAVAEQLPFRDNTFDYILMVTTICFLDSIDISFREAFRVLKPEGYIIVGFIDKDGKLGKTYQKRRKKSTFYHHATFYSVAEVLDSLRKTYFKDVAIKQTILSFKTNEINQVRNGYGKGGFVVIKAVKSNR